jgi:hypothetical protein
MNKSVNRRILISPLIQLKVKIEIHKYEDIFRIQNNKIQNEEAS